MTKNVSFAPVWLSSYSNFSDITLIVPSFVVLSLLPGLVALPFLPIVVLVSEPVVVAVPAAVPTTGLVVLPFAELIAGLVEPLVAA